MKRSFDTIVIGGGASGMTAAISAAEKKEQVLLLEKSNKLGRKMLASGNGRCNLLNRSAPRYYGDASFAEKVLRGCPLGELVRFYERYGIMVMELSEGRMYPVSLQAASVVSMLSLALKVNQVTVRLEAPVESVRYEDGLFRVTASGECYEAKRVIVTCGGLAQPKLGGSPDGYAILRSFGHTLSEPFPALVPVETDKKAVSGLSGVRVQCNVSLLSREKLLHREQGELLFTDYGISGICVMQCSRFIRGHADCLFEADFLSRVFPDGQAALRELRRRRSLFADCAPVSLLDGILPQKLASAVLRQAGIRNADQAVKHVSDENLERVLNAAYHYRIKVVSARGMDYAQVTAGGISCAEFDSETMESRLRSGLYAAGEVLNIDGDCGGFNLMFACASGILAGRSGEVQT